MNALKSGIDARNEAASGEDPAVLTALTAEYNHEFLPLGLVERLLVDILIKDDWLLRRYRFLAADLVNHGAAVAYETRQGCDFGAGFAANTESFQRLHRHILETEKSFFNHLAELERRQTLRRQHRPDVDPSLTYSPETENPEIGFVSQTTPEPSETDVPISPAALHTPSTAPAEPRPPQTHGIGFVPQTSPSVPPPNGAPLLSSALGHGSPAPSAGKAQPVPVCPRPASRRDIL
jgi:hypothetical protein